MVLLVLLSACAAGPADDSGPADPCAAGPGVVVGNGQYAHIPVEDGDTVEMVHGPQGGWHIWYSLLATNLGDLVTFRITGDDEELGARIVDQTLSVALVPEQGSACAGESYGVFGYLPLDEAATEVDESPPAWLVGHTVVMGVDVTNLEDTSQTAHDEVRVTTVCDPSDVGVYAECG